MDIDEVIKKMVDDIWEQYDDDNSGELDKEETRQFVQDNLEEMADGAKFNDRDFEQCFLDFDKDGSGTIDKDEMVQFIKRVAGLDEIAAAIDDEDPKVEDVDENQENPDN